MPAFSLLHPSYTCQHFPCSIQATHANIFPVASKLHMPALSLLCPKATHTISVSSITSTATPNRKLLHNNLIKLAELINSKSVNIHDTGDMIHKIQHKAHNLSKKTWHTSRLFSCTSSKDLHKADCQTLQKTSKTHKRFDKFGMICPTTTKKKQISDC